jgi:hypothetical protein
MIRLCSSRLGPGLDREVTLLSKTHPPLAEGLAGSIDLL